MAIKRQKIILKELRMKEEGGDNDGDDSKIFKENNLLKNFRVSY